jgi:ATP-dependent RNA helicase DDX52/ROK1
MTVWTKEGASAVAVPEPVESFEQLSERFGVSALLLENVRKAGYEAPTPIQMQALPAMMAGRQVMACAPTGSGKTAAFLLPIVHQLKAPSGAGVRAIVVAPTRELANQTHRSSPSFSFKAKTCLNQ